MNHLAVLVLALALGAGLRHWWSGADVALRVTRLWVIWVALPAVILGTIPTLSFGWAAWTAGVAGWLGFLGAAALFLGFGPRWGWSRQTCACLVLTAGLGNTSFVGLPAVTLLAGEQGVGPALVFDQLGSFLALAVGGGWVVAWGRSEAVAWSQMGRKLLGFPPTLALVWALMLPVPQAGAAALSGLAATLSPTALLAVGLAAVWPRARNLRPLAAGLAWKLAAFPALAWGLVSWQHVDAAWAEVIVLQAAMAPMVTGGIVASQADLDPELASQMVVVGLVVSVPTLLSWHALV